MDKGHYFPQTCAATPLLTHHHIDEPVSAAAMLVRLTCGHSERDLRTHHVSLWRLRSHHSRKGRIIVPFDQKLATELPSLVLSVFTGELLQEARLLGFEVIFAPWQPRNQRHTHQPGATCSYTIGADVALHAKKKDTLLLLKGSGMQKHLACALRFAKEKKLIVATNNKNPVLMRCDTCYCPTPLTKHQ